MVIIISFSNQYGRIGCQTKKGRRIKKAAVAVPVAITTPTVAMSNKLLAASSTLPVSSSTDVTILTASATATTTATTTTTTTTTKKKTAVAGAVTDNTLIPVTNIVAAELLLEAATGERTTATATPIKSGNLKQPPPSSSSSSSSSSSLPAAITPAPKRTRLLKPDKIPKEWTDITFGEFVTGVTTGTHKLFTSFMATIDPSSVTKNLDPIFIGMANRKNAALSTMPPTTTTSTQSVMVTTATQTNSKELLKMEPFTKLTRWKKVEKGDWIPLNNDAFMYKKTKNDGVSRRDTDTKPGNTAVKAKSRAVKDIIEAIDAAHLTDEQKVLAVKTTSVHPSLRKFFISARLIDVDDYGVMEHSLN